MHQRISYILQLILLLNLQLIILSTLENLMKVKPFKEEVIALALQFFAKDLGETAIAEQLRQKYLAHAPQWILKNNLLVKKGLIKVIKSFVQMDKKIKQYYVNRTKGQESSSEHQIQQQEKKVKKSQQKANKNRKVSSHSLESQKQQVQSKPTKKKNAKTQQTNGVQYHENTTTWVKNKFAPPQKLQNIGKNEKITEQKVKTNKKQKPAMISKQASSEQSQDRPLHQQDSEEQQKSKKNKKQIKNKNKNVNENENNTNKKQMKKKQLKQKQKSSSQQQQSEEQVKKPVAAKQKKVAKEEKKIRKQLKAQQSEEQEEKPNRMHTRSEDHKQQANNAQQAQPQSKYRSQYANSSFSRIKVDQVGPIKTQLQDNSFEAKFKYGKGGDQWGRYGHERLKDTRGDSFKKTKDKLKNKAFQGGNIDFNVINSIPID